MRHAFSAEPVVLPLGYRYTLGEDRLVRIAVADIDAQLVVFRIDAQSYLTPLDIGDPGAGGDCILERV